MPYIQYLTVPKQLRYQVRSGRYWIYVGPRLGRTGLAIYSSTVTSTYRYLILRPLIVIIFELPVRFYMYMYLTCTHVMTSR